MALDKDHKDRKAFEKARLLSGGTNTQNSLVSSNQTESTYFEDPRRFLSKPHTAYADYPLPGQHNDPPAPVAMMKTNGN